MKKWPLLLCLLPLAQPVSEAGFKVLSQGDVKAWEEKADNFKESGFHCPVNGTVRYRVKFHHTWTPKRHPTAYPSEAAWSQMVVVSHTPWWKLWEEGHELVESVGDFVMTGDVTSLTANLTAVQEKRMSGPRRYDVLDFSFGEGTDEGDGVQSACIEVDTDHFRLSVMAKLMPSPDWFAGITFENLCRDKEYIGGVSFKEIYPFDGGVDSARVFKTTRLPTDPVEEVAKIECGYTFCPHGRDTANGNPHKTLHELLPLGWIEVIRCDSCGTGFMQTSCGSLGDANLANLDCPLPYYKGHKLLPKSQVLNTTNLAGKDLDMMACTKRCNSTYECGAFLWEHPSTCELYTMLTPLPDGSEMQNPNVYNWTWTPQERATHNDWATTAKKPQFMCIKHDSAVTYTTWLLWSLLLYQMAR